MENETAVFIGGPSDGAETKLTSLDARYKFRIVAGHRYKKEILPGQTIYIYEGMSLANAINAMAQRYIKKG